MKINEMIKATMARLKELSEEYGYNYPLADEAFEIDGVGIVACKVMSSTNISNSSWMRPHFRTTWRLNGKKISKQNLIKILEK